jgi:hypothetical protein
VHFTLYTPPRGRPIRYTLGVFLPSGRRLTRFTPDCTCRLRRPLVAPYTLHSSQRSSDTVHSGSLPSIRLLSDTVHTRLYLSVALSFCYILHSLQRPPECGALCKLLADLSVFASQEGFSPSMGFAMHLSIRPPSDTVHTRLFLMVALTFLYTIHSLQRPPEFRRTLFVTPRY